MDICEHAISVVRSSPDPWGTSWAMVAAALAAAAAAVLAAAAAALAAAFFLKRSAANAHLNAGTEIFGVG